jgi:hypothetical protein
LELPASRLINLIWFAISGDKTPEEQDQMKNNLFERSSFLNPLEELKDKVSKKPKPVTLLTKPEEPKTLGRRTDYIPPWWQGEKAAYTNAKAAMKGVSNLPKMKK